MSDETQWQPIETAPQDGKPVLLCARDCGYRNRGCEVQIGFYLGMSYGHLFIGEEEWTGWLSMSTHEDHGDSQHGHLTPTHWMPLPDPPPPYKGKK